MKTIGKLIICILVILTGVGIAMLISNNKETNSTNTSGNITNNSTNNETNNNKTHNIENKKENSEYIGIEENVEVPEETKPEKTDEKEEQTQQKQEESIELTGEEKAIDIVKKQYALNGQTVGFDHMEGADYIIKLNEGTAITWYIVDGETWEASEY